MKHPTSRALHAYWDALRGARAAPERGEIAPGEIRHVLADSFILELDVPNRDARFRLAGTRVCAAFGCELRGHAFASLWAGAAGPGGANARGTNGWSLVDLVLSETLGVVVGLTGRSADGDPVDLEMVLLPLRHRGRTHERMLGALSAFARPLWLGPRPLARLDTTSLRVLTPGAATRAAMDAGTGAGAGDRAGREFGREFAPIPPGAARRRTFVVLPGGAAAVPVGGVG